MTFGGIPVKVTDGPQGWISVSPDDRQISFVRCKYRDEDFCSLFVVDADGQTLGRLASQVARVLMGKENPQYTPFLDTGDHVIVINAEKIKTTGFKSEAKQYHHYTGYPGGLRTEDYKKRLVRKPEAIIEAAVRRMLPKNKLAAHMLSKLNVYRGDKHPHQAQKPQDLKLEVREYKTAKVAVS